MASGSAVPSSSTRRMIMWPPQYLPERQFRPDAVIMDVVMPRMNGIEATRIITAELPETRVIGLSMYVEADRAEAMREAGAIDYLTKGGHLDELVAAIRRPFAVQT